jgi:uncharacterized membrane protein (UPF0127 family)
MVGACQRCGRQWLPVVFPGVGAWVLAERAKDLAAGLSGRPSIPDGTGMLFDMGKRSYPRFWMRGVSFPLDLLFLDDGAVVDLASGALPYDERFIVPRAPARYVLEVPGGWCARSGVGVGQRTVF